MIAQPMNERAPRVEEWNRHTLAVAYEFFQIKDEWSICPCGRRTKRVLDGKCYTCHLKLFAMLGRTPCPPLPEGEVKL